MLMNENRNVMTVTAAIATVAGDYVGQLVFDTATNIIHVCTVVGAAGVATWRDVATAP